MPNTQHWNQIAREADKRAMQAASEHQENLQASSHAQQLITMLLHLSSPNGPHTVGNCVSWSVRRDRRYCKCAERFWKMMTLTMAMLAKSTSFPSWINQINKTKHRSNTIQLIFTMLSLLYISISRSIALSACPPLRADTIQARTRRAVEAADGVQHTES